VKFYNDQKASAAPTRRALLTLACPLCRGELTP
jgi:hypothetical protein